MHPCQVRRDPVPARPRNLLRRADPETDRRSSRHPDACQRLVHVAGRASGPRVAGALRGGTGGADAAPSRQRKVFADSVGSATIARARRARLAAVDEPEPLRKLRMLS
jgi:hypothetical protein